MMWLLAACVPVDPEITAWHQAIEVTAARHAEGDCAAEPVEIDPVEPYLFMAINEGVPDLASWYWCASEEDCPTVAGSVYLIEFDEQRLTGTLAEPIVDLNLCTVFWFDLDATRTASGAVDLTFRSGRVEAPLDPDACEEAAPAAIGVDCLDVYEVEGVQVGD